MTTAKRKVESILLKERRILINSGVGRKLIKICGNSRYINKTKVGSANEDFFIRCQQLQDQSHDPTPTRRDTNNVLSATAASNAANHTTNTTNGFISDQYVLHMTASCCSLTLTYYPYGALTGN